MNNYNMINSFTKIFIKAYQPNLFKKNIPIYYFIIGRMFNKNKIQENSKEKQQQAKRQSQILEREKKKMKKEAEEENQYDFLQRQKDIELDKDFRKEKQKYKNIIPEGIGKSGFNQLVYWSQNAHTPQQIVDLIQKFNKLTLSKFIQDQKTFLQFIQNVKQTVYIAQTYKILVEYAYFGFKYQIKQPEYWMKIQEKVVRRPPKTQQQTNELIDILFVMGNMEAGQIIFSKSEKILQNKQFTVQQIAKLMIAYFKTSKGQKQWIVKLLANLEYQIDSLTCEVIESILPILKQSKNIPMSFQQKLIKKIMSLRNQMQLNLICIVAHYFGFEKGNKQFWTMLEEESINRIKKIKIEKGKISSFLINQLIIGVLSAYKFSSQFVMNYIIPEIQEKDCKVLYKLTATTLSILSKCLYIYQMQEKTKTIQETIQGLIMKHFQKSINVKSQDLIHVLKDYTITRVGSREFYLFLENIVNEKLYDLKTERYTVEALTAIYQQSNLCSTDTLQLLRGMAYN